MSSYPPEASDEDLRVELTDSPGDARLFLFHEVDTFRRLVDTLITSPRFKVGDTCTHGIALRLHDLVRMIDPC